MPSPFDGRLESLLSISEVRFGVLDEAEIRRYVASGEPMDKAGAYGIQGHAGLFVEHLAGSYTGRNGSAALRNRTTAQAFCLPALSRARLRTVKRRYLNFSHIAAMPGILSNMCRCASSKCWTSERCVLPTSMVKIYSAWPGEVTVGW